MTPTTLLTIIDIQVVLDSEMIISVQCTRIDDKSDQL